MKDSHIQVKAHNELHKKIYNEVLQEMGDDLKKFNYIIWIKLGLCILTGVGLYTVLIQVSHPFVFLLAYIAYGILLLLIAFNFSHDFSHDNVFKSKKLNNIGYFISFTIVGAHAAAWKYRHVHSHHYAPNVKDFDPDLNITNLIRVIPDSPQLWFHKYQHLYAPFAYTSYSLFWIFIKDFYILYFDNENMDQKDSTYHLLFWIQKAIYIAVTLLIPMVYSMQTWWFALLGFFVMHAIQSMFLLFTFFMTHHVMGTAYPKTDMQGKINESWVMNQILSSNDMHPFSHVANFVLGGFNNHIAHHLFPNIHHVHYPKMNIIVYRTLREHNIEPNQTSYWGGIVSHLKLLKKMGEPVKKELSF